MGRIEKTVFVSYRRTKDDAEMIPLYFLFEVPADRDEGILLIQRFRQRSPRSAIVDPLKKWFREAYPDHVLVIDPLSNEAALRAYFDGGQLKELHFIKFELPRDLEDRYDREVHREEEGIVDYAVRARRGRELPLMGAVRRIARREATAQPPSAKYASASWVASPIVLGSMP